MVLTPEQTSKGSIVALFIVLVLIITGAFFVVMKSLPVSFGSALLVVSALLVLFYSQEIGILVVFLFVVLALVGLLITFNAETGFVLASMVVGVFVLFSLVK